MRMAALPLRMVDVEPGVAGLAAVSAALTARLDADGPPFALVPQVSRHITADYARMVTDAVRPGEPVDDPDTALVVATSGSTGTPRGVSITRANLRAAVHASGERIDGLRECAWVIALPVTSIGGFGALVRAHLAGTPLHALPSMGGAAPFDPADLVALPVREPFAISLVPTQIADIVDSESATEWLTRATAVIVGAAAMTADLASRARDAGIRLVTTYGMTETTGGCVYDGLPLPGVTIDIVDGRIEVEGPQVTAGYRDGSDGFSGDAPERRFRTTDRGEWRDGRLVVLGRLDDVVTVNGVNVSLGAVEAVVRTELGVRDVAVVAAPDIRRGARIVAYVEMSDPAGLPAIAPLVSERLGGAARPEVVQVDALPHLPNGKIDRRALVERAARD